jgi:SHS2 domain-containing protein
MTYKLLEHEADVGIEARGGNLAEVFQDGATAMFEVMADTKSIKATKKVEISCQADDIPALFIEWLNQLLATKDIESLIFSRFEVEIKHDKTFTLHARAWGEEPDEEKHSLKTEVKAATYSGLDYKKNGEHIIRCVLDI